MPERDDDINNGNGEGGRLRPFWSGTISFGLVSVPVELYPGNRTERVSLRMLDADGTPLSRRYFCSKDQVELDYNDIVRGYPIEKDKFIIVTDEELEALEPDKSRDIDLRRFVKAAEIDPLYFERAYFLAPAGGTSKAYRLLAETMEDGGFAGIATFVMRDKEYLVAILAENGILRAETMRFPDELRTPEDVDLPRDAKANGAQVKKFESEIGKLAEKTIDPTELQDDRTERLLELIAEKQAAGEGMVATEEAGRAEDEKDEQIVDIMSMLKQRMQETQSEDEESEQRETGRSQHKKTGSRSRPKKKSSKNQKR